MILALVKNINIIETEMLNLISVQMKDIFNKRFELEEAELLNPKVDKSSKLFRLGYREVYFNLVGKIVNIYFSNSTHKKLEILDQLIHRLTIGVKNRKIGFLYFLDKKIDKKIRPYANYLMENKHLNLAELLNESPDLEEKLPILEEYELIEINDKNIVLTHKLEVFYGEKSKAYS